MRKSLLFLAFFILPSSFFLLEAQEISLEDVVAGTYRAKGFYGAQPLPDGNAFATIVDGGHTLLRHSYDTGQATDTILTLSDLSFSSYAISPDGRYFLLATHVESIYRRSYTAEHYLYDTQTHSVEPLSTQGAQECPLFSPDSRMVGFVRDNNLYVKHIDTGTEEAITIDGRFNYIINGKPDWVYEEEFEYNRAFDFSADSRYIAYMRSDESQVRTFSFPFYRGTHPEMEANTLYPSNYEYKYPKAGETNSTVSVFCHDLTAHHTQPVSVPLDSDGYIPRLVFWPAPKANEPGCLAIFTLNRRQNRCDLYLASPATGEASLLMSETNDRYINVSFYNSLALSIDALAPQAVEDGKGLSNPTFLSERDGWQHLYLLNPDGHVQQLTKGHFNVTAYYGEANGQYYYASNEGSPLEQYIYRIDAEGNKALLTPQKGFHTAAFSADMSHFLHTFSDLNTPTITSLCDAQGNTLTTLEENAALKQNYETLRIGKPQLFTFTTSEGITLNGWMVKPADFDSTRHYPVLMYQYSGPGDQQVHNSWNNGNAYGLIWEHRLAQKGYIVVCVDGRGTGGRGEDFQKCTYLTMGDLESKDQVEVALYLGSLPYVDATRIAIWGWSFGGFNTIMSMTEGRPAFRCGVAVAPVTDWRFYDSAYTERYMRTPQENPTGYDTSPLHRFSQLSGDLLLIHGLADDNVHFQNTAELAEQLVQAGIPFDMHTYTNRNHSIYGGNTRLHLFQRIERFLDQHLTPQYAPTNAYR